MKLNCIDISKVYIEPISNIRTLVLRGIDLEIQSKSKECITLYGTSGSGKTTFLEILTLGQTITAGSFEIDGKNVERFSQGEMTNFFQKIGYLKQLPMRNVFPTQTAQQNLSIALSVHNLTNAERIRRIQQLLSDFDLEQRKDLPANRLSGGELQRLGLAIAIAPQPQILFLDEPFSEQNFVHTRRIVEVLKQLQEETSTTILIASHNPYIFKFATRVCHLVKGLLHEVKQEKNHKLYTKSFVIRKEDDYLYLPPDVFPRTVNLIQLQFSDGIQIHEYEGPTKTRENNVCYLSPEGKILLGKHLHRALIHDKYEGQLTNHGKSIILNGLKG